MITSARVFETSVDAITNSPTQDFSRPDDCAWLVVFYTSTVLRFLSERLVAVITMHPLLLQNILKWIEHIFKQNHTNLLSKELNG